MTRHADPGWATKIGLVAATLVLMVGGGALAVGLSAPSAGEGGQDAGAAYDTEQLCNAATIIAVGSGLGLSTRDQTIAVMTAMGESSLRNIPYGDWEISGERNPDGSPTTSVGLFQQQDQWGSQEQRLDPRVSASLFYRAMTARVPQPERDVLEPSLVAHRTQVNDDPSHYAPYWPRAVVVVEKLTDEDTGVDAAQPAVRCP